MKRFKTYQALQNDEALIRAEAPAWNKDFTATDEWGPLAADVAELLGLIEQTAEILRTNVPKSGGEIVGIRQSTGPLEIRIRGGVRQHTDLDMWVTKKTLLPVMRVLCSMRNLKDRLENLTAGREIDIYHNVHNALRYVQEPATEDLEGHYFDTSGDYILPGTALSAPELKAKNLFRRVGWVFVGDEPREPHGTYIAEVVARLKDKQQRQSKDLTKPIRDTANQIQQVGKKRWSKIMTKGAIAIAVGVETVHKLNVMVENGTYEIRNAGNRESWQIRIDKLDPLLQKKLSPRA